MEIGNVTAIIEETTTTFVEVIAKNSLSDYYLALGLFVFFSLFFLIFQRYILHRLEPIVKKTKGHIDDAVVVFLDGLPNMFYLFLSFFIAFQTLTFGTFVTKFIRYTLYIIIFLYIVRNIFRAINYIAHTFIEEKEEQQMDTTVIPLISIIAKITIAILIFIMVLSALGINVTGLVAGVGIGGVAIAFALQNILSDLFSSFSIYFDKPFKKGDFVIIGDDKGTIKEISLKSTRIKTLQGQELIIPNSTITNSRINNYKRMKKRRIAFTIGVTYGTPYAKLKKIPTIVQTILEKIDKVTFDRVHFKSYGDFSLNYEIVYHINGADYELYMDIQQQFNLELYRQFEKEGIDFAFPTQIIHLKKETSKKQ